MKKIIILLLITSFIKSCGFAPVYISSKDINFNIVEVTFKGDQELNNFINIGLKKYNKNNNQNNNFKISTSTYYTKVIQSKDTKGNAQSFKVDATVTFKVIGNSQTYNFIYSEQSTLNNLSDTFELKSYESSIKQNFASSMIEKLILDLSNR